MKSMPDKSVDAVITDPPYNVGLNYSDGDNRPDYSAWCLEWLSECNRVAQCALLTPGIGNITNYPQPKWVLCWNKKYSGTRGGSIAVVNRWEPVFVYGKPNKKLGGDLFEFSSDCYRTDHRGPIYDTGDHPCPKPLGLMVALVSGVDAHSVLDPFMGSGTTGAACMQLGVDFIGCEIDPKYFAIAEKRIKAAASQEVMFK
jgi:DNA modification methylase